MLSTTRGISVCDFKVKQRAYRKIQIYWTSTDGEDKRTTLSLGSLDALTKEFELAAVKLCEAFRRAYRKAVKEKEEFDETDEDKLKADFEALKLEFKQKKAIPA